jgi:hypothetical protein
MVWIVTGVVLGVLALAALGFLSLRVWRALRGLTKELGRASSVLTESAAPVRAQTALIQSARTASGATRPARTQSVPPGGDESLSVVR